MSTDHALPPDIDLTRRGVWRPVRQVQIGDQQFDRNEADITVSHNGTAASARIALWNLAQSSWVRLTRGDRVRVTLGWVNGPSRRVFDGTVERKHSARHGSDHKYTVVARSQGSAAVRERHTGTWKDAPTARIVRGIAAKTGLGVGYLGTDADASRHEPPTIDGYWNIRESRRVEAWLDELAERASRETGQQFEWYIDRGDLSFHAKADFPPSAVRLTTADSILELVPERSMTSQTNNVEAASLMAFCHPLIQRGSTIEIGHTTGGKGPRQGGRRPEDPLPDTGRSEEATRRYRCARYRFETGTTLGHHIARGVVVPENAKYRADTKYHRGGR